MLHPFSIRDAGTRFFTSVAWSLIGVTLGLAALSMRPTLSRAATPGTTESGEPAKLPIDILQERLSKKKANPQTAKIKILDKALSKLNARDSAGARKLAKPLANDPDYGDYAQWILARALLLESERAFDKHNYSECIKVAKDAMTSAARIDVANPYTPLGKQSALIQGRAEIAIAASLAASDKGGDPSPEAAPPNKKKKGAKSKPERPKNQDSTKVLEAFERALQRLQDAGALSELRPKYLELFAANCNKHSTELCYAWVQRLATYFPRTSPENKALAKHFPSAVDATRSHQSYSKLTQTYRSTELDVAAFDPALATYMSGNHRKAVDEFSRFLDEFPRSTYRYRAKFWLGEALMHLGNHDRAFKIFQALQQESPFTYYGLMAAVASNTKIEAAIDGSLPLAIDYDASLQPAELVRIKRSEQFLASGSPALASLELKDIKPRDTLSSPFLLYLATLQSEAGAHRSSFITLSDLIQRGSDRVFSSFVLRLIFPMPYVDLIQKHAKENNLDPILVLSLMKQESAFDTQAGSITGAVGLMQLMPATAVDTMPDVLRADLADPEVNVKIGTRYLRQILSRFNGNIVLALAGYNAGPGAADRWFKAFDQKRGILEFIETIPYRETREYVSSIIRNYYWYKHKLTGEMPNDLNYFFNIYGPPPRPGATNLTNPAAGNGSSANPGASETHSDKVAE